MPPKKPVDTAALAALITLFALAFYGYATLPDTIATHFDFHNQANGWGSKGVVFIMPGVGLFIYLVYAFIPRMPTRFLNLPVALTPENRARQLQLAFGFMGMLRLEVLVLFLYTEWGIIASARGVMALSLWSVAAFIAVLLGTIIVYFRTAYRLR